jgi:hypothetical protein
MIDELGTMWKKIYLPVRWLISLREELSSNELLNIFVYGFIADEEVRGRKTVEMYLLFSTFWEFA